MAEPSWVSDFGQTVDLCARIREVLLTYSDTHTAVIKELLQNAGTTGEAEANFRPPAAPAAARTPAESMPGASYSR